MYDLDNIINCNNENSLDMVSDLFYEIKLTSDQYKEIEKIVMPENARNNDAFLTEISNMVKKKYDDAEKIKDVKKKKIAEIE